MERINVPQVFLLLNGSSIYHVRHRATRSEHFTSVWLTMEMISSLMPYGMIVGGEPAGGSRKKTAAYVINKNGSVGSCSAFLRTLIKGPGTYLYVIESSSGTGL